MLKWINDTGTHFKTFIRNRLSSIHELTPDGSWRHVPTKLNPADVCSRGLDPGDERWGLFLKGPAFLWEEESQWPLTQLYPLKLPNLPTIELTPPTVWLNAMTAGAWKLLVKEAPWAMHLTEKLGDWLAKLRRIAW